MLTRIDHVGIACRDLDRAIAFYESTFGLAVVSRERNEDQGVTEAMLRVADAPGWREIAEHAFEPDELALRQGIDAGQVEVVVRIAMRAEQVGLMH